MIFAHWIQTTFGGGLICNSNQILTDLSQFQHSNWISTSLTCHLQRNTTTTTDTTLHDCSRYIPASSVALDKLRKRYTSCVLCTATWLCDCSEGEMIDLHFSCFCTGKQRHQRSYIVNDMYIMSLPQQPMHRDGDWHNLSDTNATIDGAYLSDTSLIDPWSVFCVGKPNKTDAGFQPLLHSVRVWTQCERRTIHNIRFYSQSKKISAQPVGTTLPLS